MICSSYLHSTLDLFKENYCKYNGKYPNWSWWLSKITFYHHLSPCVLSLPPKVQLIWEGHKNLEFSSTWFDIYLVKKITPNFCSLLRKAELYYVALEFIMGRNHFWNVHTYIFLILPACFILQDKKIFNGSTIINIS